MLASSVALLVLPLFVTLTREAGLYSVRNGLTARLGGVTLCEPNPDPGAPLTLTPPPLSIGAFSIINIMDMAMAYPAL